MTGRGMGFCVLRIPEARVPARGQDAGGRDGQAANAFRKTAKEVITMPAGDGTGPLGFGPMTGRAAGYCAGYPVPGYMYPTPGRGFWNWPAAAAYGAAPYGVGLAGYGAPYGYGAGYGPVRPRPFGRFGGGFGRGFGRGLGRGFGRGRGRGRGRFGW
jgi:hypothetical protein